MCMIEDRGIVLVEIADMDLILQKGKEKRLPTQSHTEQNIKHSRSRKRKEKIVMETTHNSSTASL